jgi:hypothetical protein
LDIYRFATSHDEPGIHISDVIAGLLGKFFSMLQRCEFEELAELRQGLNPHQEQNLALLREVLDRSLEENLAFAHYILSSEDQRRGVFFLAG